MQSVVWSDDAFQREAIEQADSLGESERKEGYQQLDLNPYSWFCWPQKWDSNDAWHLRLTDLLSVQHGLTASLHMVSACHQMEISVWGDLTACHAVEHTDVTRKIGFLFYNSFPFLCVILFLLFWFIICSCFPHPPLSSPFCSPLRHLLPFVHLFIASSAFPSASSLYSSLLPPPLFPLLIPPLSFSSDHLPQTKYYIFNRQNTWVVLRNLDRL